MDSITKEDNPLREGVRLERTADPCIVVIFGASGDLTKRKLVPALYRLTQERLLPAEFAIVGVARTPMERDEFRDKMKEAVASFSDAKRVDESVWQSFAQGIFYLAGDITTPEMYAELAKLLEQVDRERGTAGNRVFYLSTAPSLYSVAIKQLGISGLSEERDGTWTRIIIEKPFGTDLESAIRLNQEVAEVFDEDQVYRIDHYLGKETVQNLLVFRFANGIFEPIWNRQYIDHVQVTNAEALGVEGRGSYYESAGAVRGQYGPGAVLGKHVPGYREEEGVDPNSATETYAALKLYFDNWRWAGVPFYLRSGKRMPKRVTEIAIQFKEAPHLLFDNIPQQQLEPNVLVIRVQPDEGITLRVGAKVPGQVTRIRWVNMDFRYGASFGVASPEAYERLLLDCILGDTTLYARRDMTERGWEIVMPLLQSWRDHKPNFPNYESGTWGPEEADELIEKDGRRWRRP